MKRFLMRLSCVSTLLLTSSAACAELESLQLTKNLKLQYLQMDKTGDDNVYQVVIKNPHLYWVETSSMVPQLVGEIDHVGTWKFNVDTKGNSAKAISEGSTRYTLLNPTEGEVDVADFVVTGVITKNLSGNITTLKKVLDKWREGAAVSEEEVLVALEAITNASIEGKDLKIKNPNAPSSEISVDLAKLHYNHASGVMPEEFTLDYKGSNDFSFTLGNTTLSFPQVGKYASGDILKLQLPAWRTLAAFARAPNGFPDVNFNVNDDMTSKLGDGNSSFTFTSKSGEKPSVQWNFQQKGQNSADWVKLITSVQKYTASATEEHPFAAFAYDWLTSSKAAAFLSLLPMNSTFLWNGSLGFNSTPLYYEKGNADMSWLDADKNGLKILYTGGAGLDKRHEGSLLVTLVGGKATFNKAITLFNALQVSLDPFLNKYGVNIDQASPAMQDELYSLLLRYVDDAKSADSEMKFTIKDSAAGTTIGGKDYAQFAADFEAFARKYSNKQVNENIDQRLLEEAQVH